MRVLRDLAEFPTDLRGASVALGNFDGVHLGHQAVIEQAKSDAANRNAPSGVLTFEPHPRQVFRPDDPAFRLTPDDVKMARLAETGIDFTIVLTFDATLSNLSAEDFLTDLLLGSIGIGHACIGTDFKFGHGRRGSAAMMEDMLSDSGVGVTFAQPVLDHEGEVCSSTRIRAFLQSGEPRLAAALLGAPWEIWGPVSRGDQRGRLLGFPTANVPMPDMLHPKAGVYAVTAGIGEGAAKLPGVANIGDRPTVDGTDFRLEIHLFDFDQDIYGEPIRAGLVEFIRPEMKFDGLDSLKAQIAADSETARQILA